MRPHPALDPYAYFVHAVVDRSRRRLRLELLLHLLIAIATLGRLSRVRAVRRRLAGHRRSAVIGALLHQPRTVSAIEVPNDDPGQLCVRTQAGDALWLRCPGD